MLKQMDIVCDCQTEFCDGSESICEIKKRFFDLRIRCPVLNHFVPDETCEIIRNNQWGVDEHGHQSIILLAYTRGYLQRITRPLHRFLIDDKGDMIDNINKNYKDLKECWLQANTPENKHSSARGYMGKPLELVFAEMLYNKSYDIVDLEAWGNIKGRPDIIATKDGRKFAIEVKYIGENDPYRFSPELKDDKNINNEKLNQPYKIADYTLYKICESAKQLENTTKEKGEKTAVILMEVFTSDRFDMANSIGWFNFKNPVFNKPDELRKELKKNATSEKENKKIDCIIDGLAYWLSILEDFHVYNSYQFDFKFIGSKQDEF